MLIENKTNVSIFVHFSEIMPNGSWDFSEKIFETTHIHSEIGSATITSEYGQRTFRNFGKLEVKEGRKKDKAGYKNILVKERKE